MLTIILFLVGYAAVVSLIIKLVSSGSTEDIMEEKAVQYWDRTALHNDIFRNQN